MLADLSPARKQFTLFTYSSLTLIFPPPYNFIPVPPLSRCGVGFPARYGLSKEPAR